MVDRVGQQLGNYRLLRLLGQGGQASVYLGEHLYLKSQAALKVRHTVLTQEEQTVFLQEAQTLVRLSHPHIVRVLDFALQDGMPFLVMEYAPHGTLRQRHPKGTKLPLDLILPYIQQVASALQYTHDQRLIHRDVKPENLLLNSQDHVLLSDFGLVMHAPQTLASGSTELMEPSLAGTTPYLAPEQLRGKAQSTSDQYALGVVIYEWLCGKPPFQGPFLEVAVQHVSAPPPSLREQVPDLSPAIEEVVLRALAKEPEQRFAHVQDFATALAYASKPTVSPRLTPVLAPKHGVETGQRPPSMPNLPRGTVTLLFTDIEGSTRLLQCLGERYPDVLAECRGLLRAAFHQHHGHEVDTQGDAFFVAFTRATDAISAAVDAQRALASHPWPEGAAVRVRMGLHTGEPSLTSEGYVGLDVHRAARIMSAGHGGQVLLSQTTRDLVEHDLPGGVSLQDLGAHRLKDLQHKSHLFQLVMVGLPADFPPPKTLDSHPNNLPIQPTSLIGREKEVATVQHLLRREDVRLLTLTGPGGIGKTRLGLQVAAELADQYPDGVFLVSLAPVSESAQVVPAITQTLGISEAGGQPLLALLKTALKDEHLLLLLDNFEQVITAAVQVAELLTACPKLKIIVTSRVVLHVQAEHEFAVPPLSLPDPKRLPDLGALSQYEAVALFIERVQALKPDFQVTNANAPAVAAICARLDGLPLAIELAAARVKYFPPQMLLTRLEQGLAVLSSGARDLPVRQQTLRGAMAWSYDLLSPEEQILFCRCAVFVDGCTWEAAEAVCTVVGGLQGNVLEGLVSLVDKSLLRQEEKAEGEARFWMLHVVREFGLEALAASGEKEAIRQTHAAYYLALAEEAEPKLYGTEQQAWFDRLEQEHENLRAALHWLLERKEAEMALRLCVALCWFWEVHRHLSEGQQFLERALSGSEAVTASVRAAALNGAGWLAYFQNDHKLADALLRESLALFQARGDKRGIAMSLRRLGMLAWSEGNYVVASALAEKALTIFKEVDYKRGIAYALLLLAYVVTSEGEYVRASTLLEECLSIFRQLDDKRKIAVVLHRLAGVVFAQGDYMKASLLVEESLALAKKLGDKETIPNSLDLSGRLALHQGDAAKARSLLEEYLAFSRESGNPWYIADSLSSLAGVIAFQGDYVAAHTLYKESLAIARKTGSKWIITYTLEGLAGVVAAQGEHVWAARLWGASEALRQAIGKPMPPVDVSDYEQAVALARSQAGEEAFAAA